MSGEASFLAALEREISSIAAAPTPADLFRRVLGASRVAAPRAAVFLLRGERWRGWGSVGYPPRASERQRALDLSLDEGHVLSLAPTGSQGGATVLRLEAAPDFGQPQAAETVAVVLRAGDRPVAALVAERGTSESPWHPEIIGILAHVAGLRLDLDLALRKAQAPGRSAAVRTTPQASPTSAAPAAKTETGLAPLPEAGAPGAEARRREEARRFARLVATDIRLYNEEAVILGRRQRDLARRLSEHLRRGRETFLRRFHEMGAEAIGYLREAYVEVLAGGDASLVPDDPREW